MFNRLVVLIAGASLAGLMAASNDKRLADPTKTYDDILKDMRKDPAMERRSNAILLAILAGNLDVAGFIEIAINTVEQAGTDVGKALSVTGVATEQQMKQRRAKVSSIVDGKKAALKAEYGDVARLVEHDPDAKALLDRVFEKAQRDLDELLLGDGSSAALSSNEKSQGGHGVNLILGDGRSAAMSSEVTVSAAVVAVVVDAIAA
ncbi:Uncharacterized protein PBTT_01849 [Plasmodiophora brassicae]